MILQMVQRITYTAILAIASGFSAFCAPKPGVSLPSIIPAVSRDGLVEVFSREDPLQEGFTFQSCILKAASSLVDTLSQESGIEIPRKSNKSKNRCAAPIVIHVGSGTNEDERVLSKTLQDAAGSPITHIYMPSPGYSDLDEFKKTIAFAWIKAYVHRTAPARYTPPVSPVPEWLVDGIVRATDQKTKLRDRVFAIYLWKTGRLPALSKICSLSRTPTEPEKAVAGFITAWMLEKNANKSRNVFQTVLDNIASGKGCDGNSIATMLTQRSILEEQEKSFDDYALKISSKVLWPGKASPIDIDNFMRQLSITAPDFGIRFANGQRQFPFHDAAHSAEADPKARLSAHYLSQRLPYYAIGRGKELEQAGLAYTKFLNAFAAGATNTALRVLLVEANAKMTEARKASMEFINEEK